MRILILTLNYLPELTGIGKFSGGMAEWLAAREHEVRVVTTPPYYPEWRVHKGYTAYRYTKECRAGVDILRCPIWVPQQQTSLKRILNLLSFALFSAPTVLVNALRFRPDIIGVIKPPMFALPFALLAARASGARSWVHVQDFEIDVAFDMGLLKGRWLGRAALGLDNFLLKRFDLATTISERMHERLLTKGVASRKAALFRNWVDDQAIRPLPAPSPMRSMFGLNADTIVALYSGNMGEKQGLETIIDTAKKVSDDSRIVVILVGDGAARQRLENLSRGLSNIRFFPLQPLERLNDLLNVADIHLLPQRADAADLVLPSKLGGMFASGRPVIVGARNDTELAHEVEGAGLVVPPEDGAAMAQALRRLAYDDTLRTMLGAAARVKAEKYWAQQSVLLNLETLLSDLASRH